MPVFDPTRPARVVSYFAKSHLTQREIGKLEGISAPAVCKILRKMGIKASAGTWMVARCAHCHTTFRRIRSRVKRTRRPCCSHVCYMAIRKNPAYQPWRHGQRLARAAVKAAGFPLLPEQVVHHRDFNNHNNLPSNLAVFASQSDHMAFHHTGKPEPLWVGPPSD